MTFSKPAFYPVALFAFVILFAACTKKVEDPEEKEEEEKEEITTPYPFKLRWRISTRACIAWSDPANSPSGQMKYDLLIDGVKVDSNLISGVHKIQDILPYLAYNAKLVAKYPNGDTLAAEFKIPEYLVDKYFWNTRLHYDRDVYSKNFRKGYNWIFRTFSYRDVYAEGDTLYLSSEGKMELLNASTGSLLKTFNAPSVSLSNAVSDDSVLVATHYPYTYGEPGEIICFNKRDFSERWRKTSNQSYGAISPVLTKDLYITRDRDQPLVARDLKTGEVRWTFTFPGPEYFVAPSVSGNVVVLKSAQEVFGINAITGKEIWRASTYDERAGSAPTINNNAVYFGTEGIIVAVDLNTGKEFWHRTAEYGFSITGLPVDERNVYSIGRKGPYEMEEIVAATNKKTGEIVWKITLPPNNYPAHDPIVADGVLYTVAPNIHSFNLFDTYTGELLETVDFSNEELMYASNDFWFRIDKKVYRGAWSGMQQ